MRIKLKAALSSILTKVVLLTICHEHMGMHPLANGVTVCVTGIPEVASM